MAVVPAWRQLGLGVLSQVVPASLIDEAVAETGVAQRRVRLLPARVVVLFVLAMAVFSTDSYVWVWRQLVSGWPGLARREPTRSAFTQARRRIGEAPLAWLFSRVRGSHADVDSPGVSMFGLRLVAWDGTTISVPDSVANAAAFGRTRGGQGATGGYPRMWLNMLVECGTRAVLDAAFGRESEVVLAGRLVASLRPGMLLLADRNFFGHELSTAVRSRGAHLLWRVGANRVLPVLRTLPDGSWLSRIQPPRTARRDGAGRGGAGNEAGPVTVRVVRYTVTVVTLGREGRSRRVRTETFRLITSLLDPAQAPAAALAACYHQRWEIESSFRELKVWLRGPSVVLRSADPGDVRQEMWAYLIVYQTLRHLIVDAAAEFGRDTDTMSLLTCLRTARMKMINLALVASEAMTDAMTELIDHLLNDEVPPRRDRATPRVVKRPVKSYKAKKPHMTSENATFIIDIQPPDNQETA